MLCGKKTLVTRYVWLALFVALGGAIAWLAIPPSPPPPSTGPLPEVTLAGKHIPAQADEGGMLEAILEGVRAWLDEPVTIEVTGSQVTRTRERLGARVDEEHVRSLVRQLRDPASALRRGRRRC